MCDVSGTSDFKLMDREEEQGKRVVQPEGISKDFASKRQAMILNKFMISHFINGTLDRYSSIFLVNSGTHGLELLGNVAGYKKKMTTIMETILKRARCTRLHFKKACCIIVKFADSCSNEINYMKFLQYDFSKLIVTAFVLSAPGRSAGRINNVQEIYLYYCKVTGLSVDEIKNCCSIVRPPLLRQNLQNRGSTLNIANNEQSAGTDAEGYNTDYYRLVNPSEIQEFNDIGRRAVMKHFKVNNQSS